jgi:hypothetical protein
VRAGVLELDVIPWMVPAGAIGWASARFPHSVTEARG